MKRLLNPVGWLIAFNVLFVLFGDLIAADAASQALADRAQAFVEALGPAGYLGVLAAYVVCAFFFVPLLIPLNVASGALFGPYAGTAVSLAGITVGCLASTISVRHVFTGMRGVVERRPAARDLLERIGRHGAMAVLVLRLAFVVPYLLQNIVLALAPIRSHRLVLLTAAGALPGAAIYSFLGAGLLRGGDRDALGLYLAVPLLLAAVAWTLGYLSRRHGLR